MRERTAGTRGRRVTMIGLVAMAALMAAPVLADGPPVGTRIMPTVRVEGAVAEDAARAAQAPMPADLVELPVVDENGVPVLTPEIEADIRRDANKPSG
jgi:hypothetical protein